MMDFLTGLIVGLLGGLVAGGTLGAIIVGALQLGRRHEVPYDTEVRW